MLSTDVCCEQEPQGSFLMGYGDPNKPEGGILMGNEAKTVKEMGRAHKVLSTFDFEPGKVEKGYTNRR